MRNNKIIIAPLFCITELYLLANMPYIFSRFWNVSTIYISSAIFLLCLIFYLFTKSINNQQLSLKFSIPLAVTIITWLIYAVIHDDSSYLTRIVLLIITYLFLLILHRKSALVKFWKFNNLFILFQVVLSSIGFLLVALGLLYPLLTKEDMYFFGFCFAKTYIGNLIRPSGFLDEPGALATWAVYSLMLNYAFIKDKRVSKYLPFLTVVTLSIAYYIQMACFYVLAYYNKIYKVIFVGILALIAVYCITMTRDTDFDIYKKTVSRFEYSEEKGIKGNNRAIHTENAKSLFLQSPIIGVGGRTLGQEESTSDNPYEILAKDGIIGFIISYLPLIIILFNNRRKEVWICVMVVAIGYLQRPLHINFMHDMYIWSFLLFAIMDARERKWLQHNLKMEQNAIQQQKMN